MGPIDRAKAHAQACRGADGLAILAEARPLGCVIASWLLGALMVSGQAPGREPRTDPPCPRPVQSASEWAPRSCAFASEASRLSKYAYLSLLAYDDAPSVPGSRLPKGIKEELPVFNHVSGLRMRFFLDSRASPPELIVAITGTDQLRDWFTQNLLPMQRPRLDRELRAMGAGAGRYARLHGIRDKTWSVSFTGHSLGGGLAIGAAARVEHESARYGWSVLGRTRGVAFNSSPRYSGGWTKRKHKSHSDPNRIVVYESSDPTRIAGNVLFFWRAERLSRLFKVQPPVYYRKVSFDNGGIVSAHNMCAMVTGLLVAAADHDGSEAFYRDALKGGCESLKDSRKLANSDGRAVGASLCSGLAGSPEAPVSARSRCEWDFDRSESDAAQAAPRSAGRH